MSNGRAPVGRTDRGQSLAEFALVAPIFFLIIFAVLQVGLLLGGQNGLVNAVRDTARAASTTRIDTHDGAVAMCQAATSTDGVIERLYYNMQKSMPGFDIARVDSPSVIWHWGTNPDGINHYVQINISVKYDFQLYVPIVGNFLNDNSFATGQSKQLGGQETMRIENPNLTASNPADVVWPTCA